MSMHIKNICLNNATVMQVLKNELIQINLFNLIKLNLDRYYKTMNNIHTNIIHKFGVYLILPIMLAITCGFCTNL